MKEDSAALAHHVVDGFQQKLPFRIRVSCVASIIGAFIFMEFLFLSYAYASFARSRPMRGTTGILYGKIIDKKSEEPLVGANVLLLGTVVGAVADNNGEYRINNVRAGSYDVRISFIGYKTLIVRKVIIVQDLRTKVDAELEVSAVEVAPVEIRAERPLIQKDLGATAFSIGELKLDKLPISSTQEVLGLQPGTTIEGNVRGGKTSEVLFLIDGLPVQDVIGGGIGINVPKSAVTGLTVHTGGFEAEYGNALSGVVNIVTKSGTDISLSNVRVERDGWIPSTTNQQQDRYNEIELSTSGPLIPGRIHYLTANTFQTSDTRWWQDFQKFFDSPVATEFTGFSKLDFIATKEIKLSLQGIYSMRQWRDYEFSWRFNLDGVPPRARYSYRLALVLSEALSKTSFLTVSLSTYQQHSRLGVENKEELSLEPYIYDFYMQYIVEGKKNWRADSRQTIYSYKADFDFEVTDGHLFKAGGEFNQYDISSDVIKYEPQTTYFGKPILDVPMLNYSNTYHFIPRSGSLYFQDRLELERDGSIFSFGIRWDFLDPTAKRPIVEFIPIRPNEFRDTVKGYTQAKFKHQLSPRVSFVAPVGVSSFFFMNFGHYFQFPVFDYLYSGTSPVQLRQGARNVQVGNPDLEPERTIAWELGFKHGMSDKLVASLTYFRKRMLNQIDTKTLIPFDSKAAGDFGFASYVNNAEANSSGLEFVFSRERDENLSGSLSYTYMSAEGISETVNQGINYSQWGFAIPARAFPLSWDQRHTIKLDADVLLIGGVRANLIAMMNSARPYTYFPTRDGFTPEDTSKVFLPNNGRMENLYFVNVKLSKQFFIGAQNSFVVTLYADIRNLLNTKNIRWIDSNGRVGGELGDPGAYYDPRRVRVGIRVDF
jgi:outer membrane receptor protein involved in Fe transport